MRTSCSRCSLYVSLTPGTPQTLNCLARLASRPTTLIGAFRRSRRRVLALSLDVDPERLLDHEKRVRHQRRSPTLDTSEVVTGNRAPNREAMGPGVGTTHRVRSSPLIRPHDHCVHTQCLHPTRSA